jgi:Protein of unknown function (DUF3892)
VSFRLQIDCVVKDNQLNPYARIRRIGGPNLPGVPPPDASKVVAELRRRGLAIIERPRWNLAVEEAIQGVLKGTWSFFIELGVYDLVDVEVATSPSGVHYLKTAVDQDTPDELLFLPDCR